MFHVGDMKAGTLYLFKDQAHKGRCVLALKSHKKELYECDAQERSDFMEDLARASGAIKKLWGCTKLNLGSFRAIRTRICISISYQSMRAALSLAALPLPIRSRYTWSRLLMMK